MAYRILVRQWKRRVLTTGPPGKSPLSSHFFLLVLLPFLSQAIGLYSPFLLFHIVLPSFLAFSAFSGFPSFFSPFSFFFDFPLPPFRSFCSFPSVFLLSCWCSCTLASFCVCRCWHPPEELTVIWALFLTWNDFLQHSRMQVLGWFKSVIVTEGNPPPPSFIHYEKSHNSIQRLLK